MKWTKEQIKEALEKHLKWLECEVGGKRLECHDDGLAGAYLDDKFLPKNVFCRL